MARGKSWPNERRIKETKGDVSVPTQVDVPVHAAVPVPAPVPVPVDVPVAVAVSVSVSVAESVSLRVDVPAYIGWESVLLIWGGCVCVCSALLSRE